MECTAEQTDTGRMVCETSARVQAYGTANRFISAERSLCTGIYVRSSRKAQLNVNIIDFAIAYSPLKKVPQKCCNLQHYAHSKKQRCLHLTEDANFDNQHLSPSKFLSSFVHTKIEDFVFRPK